MNRPTILDTADLVVVPKEPDFQMFTAAERTGFRTYTGTVAYEPVTCFKAMISASPHPNAWEEVKAYVAELEELADDYNHLMLSIAKAMEKHKAAEARIRELEDRLEAAEKVIVHQQKALRPMSNAVFNDNGEISTDHQPMPNYEECVSAYFADRAAAKWMEDRNAEV